MNLKVLLDVKVMRYKALKPEARYPELLGRSHFLFQKSVYRL